MHQEKHGSVVQNYFFNCEGCCCRAMFPPDRAILLSITRESDVDFIARFSDAIPAQQVVKRVLTVTDAQGTREIAASDPTATSVAFTSEPSPGDNGTAFVTDTNPAGDSLASNVLEYSLTPLPPTPEPLTAPTLLSISPAVNVVRTGSGTTFRK